MLRVLLRLLVSMILWAFALWLSARFHAHTDIARSAVRDLLTGGVSSLIRGQLFVGAIEEFDGRRLTVHHAVLTDPDGVPVIRLRRATLTLASLVPGQALEIDQARGTDGELVLIDNGAGSPTFIDALSAVEGEPDSEPPSALALLLGRLPPTGAIVERIQLSHVRVHGELLGVEGIDATVERGRLDIFALAEVDVRVSELQGTLDDPYGFTAHMTSGQGSFSSDPERGIRVRARLERRDRVPVERVRARIVYAKAETENQHAKAETENQHAKAPTDDGFELRVRARVQAARPDTLVAVGLPWFAKLTPSLSGRFSMQGPLASLAFESHARTVAGSARVTGLLDDDQAVVRVESEGLELSTLLPDAPALVVSGSGELTLPTVGSATLTAELGPTRYAGLAIPSLAVQARIEDETITLTRVEGRQRGAQLSANGVMDFDGAGRLRVAARFEEVSRDANLRRLLPGLGGSLDARLRVDTHGRDSDRMEVEGDLRLRRFRLGSLRAREVHVTGRSDGHPKRPTLDLSLAASGLQVDRHPLGDAQIGVRGGPKRYRVEGRLHGLDTRSVSLAASVEAQGGRYLLSTDSLVVSVAGRSWHGSARNLGLSPRGRFDLESLELVDGSQRLRLSAKLHGAGDDWVQAQLEDFDLTLVRAFLDPGAPLSGRADASVQVAGDLSRPTWSIEGALRRAAYGMVNNIDGRYFVRYEAGIFELDGQVDLGARGRLSANGSGIIDAAFDDLATAVREGVYNIRTEVDDLQLLVVPALSWLPEAARASAAIDLHGSPVRPALRGQLAASGIPAVEGYDVSGTATVTYEREVGVVDFIVDDAHGAVSTGELEMTVPISFLQEPQPLAAWLRRPFSLQAELHERPSTVWPAPLPQDLPVVTGARGRLELRKSGGPMTGNADLWLSPVGVLRDTGCQLVSRPAAHVRARLQDGAVRAFVSGSLDGQQVLRVTAGTAAPILRFLETGSWPAHPLNAELAMRLPEIQSVPWLCQLGTGDMTVSATLTDGLTDAPSLSAQLRAALTPAAKTQTKREQVQIRSCEGDPATVRVAVSADAETADVGAQLSGCGGGEAKLEARAPMRWQNGQPAYRDGEPLSGAATFEGAQLRAFVDRIPGVLTGAATAHGRVAFAGTPDDLRWDGQLDIDDGELIVTSMGQRLDNVQAGLVFKGNQVDIRTLKATSDQGSVALKGAVSLASFRPERAQLVVDLQDFPIRQEGIKTAWLSGAGALETEWAEDRARTAVKVHRLDVLLPDSPPASLQSLDPHPDVEVLLPEPLPPRKTPYALEFMVDGTRGVRVRRNDFETLVRTELAVSYLDPELRLGGYVEFQRGRFEVLGKPFDVRRGGMRFSGGTDFDPEVNLVATHLATGGDLVRVTVSGTLSRPDIVFASEACPGEAGALSLLLTGRCADARDSLQSSENAEAEFASGLLYGLFTLGARKELGGVIPNLALESGAQGYATRVRAGVETDALIPAFMRSIVKKVYVQGAVSTAQSDSTVRDTPDQALLDFLIEVYFLHNIVGSGHFAPETDTWGLDVTWEP